MLKLCVHKISETAILPSKAHTSIFEDACFDLFADGMVVVQPGERVLVNTGLSIIIPDGYWVKFHDRSGNAYKGGLMTMAGVIDSGFTGDWKILVYNCDTRPFILPHGKALVQFSLELVQPCEIVEIDKSVFDNLAGPRLRKDSGYGSSDGRV